jgi:hypothetical protein
MADEPSAPTDFRSIESPEGRTPRPTLKRPDRPDRPDRDEPARPKGQARSIEARFLLRVDGQVKRSFDSKEPASIAGAAIKEAHPVVVVTVVDTQEHTTEIIKA